MLVFSIVFGVCLSSMNQQSRENISDTAAYFELMLSDSFNDTYDDSLALLLNAKVRRLKAYSAQEMKEADVLRIAYLLKNDLTDFVTSHAVLSDILIYYPDADRIISTKGSHSSYAYFKLTHMSKDPQLTEYERWRTQLFEEKNTHAIFMLTDPVTAREEIFFSIPLAQDLHCILQVDQANMQDLLAQMNAVYGYAFAGIVCEENGHIYAASSDVEHQSAEMFETNQFPETAYFRTEVKINNTNFELVLLQSFANVYTLFRSLLLMMLTGSIIALLLALSISLHFTRKQKARIQSLVEKLGSYSCDPDSDGYAILEQQIETVQQQNTSAINALKEQQHTVGSCFLRELLNLPPQDDSCEMLMSLYNINFEGDYYVLLSASTYDIAEGSGEINDQFLFSEDLPMDLTVFKTTMEHHICYLCNYSPLRESYVRKISQVLRQSVGDSLVHSSPVVTSLQEIVAYWNQSFSQKDLTGAHGKPLLGPDAQYFLRLFTLNQETPGDMALREALDLALTEADRLEGGSRCLAKMMLCCQTYEKSPDSCKQSMEQAVLSAPGFDYGFLLRQILYDADTIAQTPKIRIPPAEAAKKIIDLEYENPQLSLCLVADRIGVNPAYLSHTFKENYAMGFLTYLNQTRLNAAKKLLCGGNDNLKVIALKVGLLSDVSLIRIFKRMENTTPGKFRGKGD